VYPDDPYEALAAAGRDVIERGLSWGTSGNISLRLDDDRFLISGTGARLSQLEREALAVCALQGDAWSGGRRPSVEVNLHRAIYQQRPEARAVLHTSAPFTTLVACTRVEVPTDFNTDALFYVREVARVPFRNPGSVELAEATRARCDASRVLLLDNHGAICWGESLHEVVIATEALELLCSMLVRARAAGLELAHLSAEQLASFRYQAGLGPAPPAARGAQRGGSKRKAAGSSSSTR